MNSVPTFSEFLAEFGTNDAATAVGRINSYADVHCETCLVLCALYFVNQLIRALSKYQAQSTKFNRQRLRQATLAIACLYLNLTHLLRGGQVRAGSIFLVLIFSNEFCNEAAAFL